VALVVAVFSAKGFPMQKLSKKHQEQAICPSCGEWATTDFTPEELKEKEWECSECMEKRLTHPEDLPENKGQKPITKFSPEFEWLLKLVNVIAKAAPEAVPEIKALAQSHPFKTIDDAGDLAAQIWTLAVEKYGIPREWLMKKLPEKKSSLNVKSYTDGYSTENDAEYFGWGPYGTTPYQPMINHDAPTGLREGDDGEPLTICPRCKSSDLKKEGEKATCNTCGTNFIPKPDRGSDDQTVNDYSQNYFWGPRDLGTVHQHQPGDSFWLPAGTENDPGVSSNVMMSSLEKKASDEYWIDPFGKVYLQDSETHADWIDENAGMLNDEYDLEIYQTDNMHDLYWLEQLIKQGWTRVTSPRYIKAQFLLHVNNFNNLDRLNDFVAEHFDPNSELPIAVGTDAAHEVLITNPFPSLQKAVNDTKRQPTMSSLKKKADLYSEYWISPNGKLNEVEGHSNWIKFHTKELIGAGIESAKTVSDIWHSDPKKFDEEVEAQLDLAVESAWEEMISKGWVRIGGGEDEGLQFYVDLKDFSHVPAYLDNYIAEWYDPDEADLPIEVSDINNKRIEVYDPFPSFQRAVLKARRRPIMSAFKSFMHKQSSLNKAAHCGPCSALKMEALHILIDLYYKDDSLFPEEVIEELSVAATELKLDNYNDILESVIEEYLEERAEEVGDKLPKLKNLLIALKDIAPKLGKEIEVVDKQAMLKQADSPRCICGDKLKDHWWPGTPEAFCNGIMCSSSGEVCKQFIPQTNKESLLRKQANPPSRFWIAPDGKEFPVPSAGHGLWIKQNYNLVKPYGIDPLNLDMAYKQMVDAGWTRISNEPHSTGFQIEVRDIHNIPAFLNDFVAKYYQQNEVIQVGDVHGNLVMVHDPFPFLQNAINKSHREPITAALLDDVLDQTTQDAIAAEYGINYLLPLRFYGEALSYGQSADRAFQYAVEESKRMNKIIDIKKLAELIDTYF
jgi:hypothetical protein